MSNVKEMILDENCINHSKDIKITCRDDLTPYFKAWDHSNNKVHLSKVNMYIYIYVNIYTYIYKKEEYILFIPMKFSVFLFFLFSHLIQLVSFLKYH